MAVKAGSILHVGHDTVVVDRLQTAGPGSLNIPTEKIYELGNYESVATIRDVPDLQFSMESFDTSTEIEAMLIDALAERTLTADGAMTAADATLTSASAAWTTDDVGKTISVADALGAGIPLVARIVTRTSATVVELSRQATATVAAKAMTLSAGVFDLATARPLNLASQFKAGKTAVAPFDIVASVGLPFLALESASYRFGLRDNARQTFGLRGDSIFYNPGSTYVDEFEGDGVETDFATTHPAYNYVDSNGARRVLAVVVDTVRMSPSVDYTTTNGAITSGAATATVVFETAPVDGARIRVMYASPDVRSYPQTVHQDATVKPAAVRGKDIDIYVGGYDPDDVAGSAVNKWGSVQAANVDWRVTLEKDEEFGNYFAVAQDFDVPSVTGSVDIKPRDPAEMFDKIRQITGVTDVTQVVGPNTAVALPLDIVIKDGANAGRTLKRLHVPDARFSVPGYQGRVQQKLVQTLNFESDAGSLLIYRDA